eukprot:NODE_4868_length_1102_cov_40.055158_g4322_i0.p1 GENE.NODE_4868_length_1102_cov_40.055158_g4322_i0~~NODE_4868_length_1102_cov_40.055158_g4322_i0.p1  ORF type:complete len:309 (-),score=60.08 NODE_4868_length_1102_cov_40.055158_g4322_i0:78-1004(-)
MNDDPDSHRLLSRGKPSYLPTNDIDSLSSRFSRLHHSTSWMEEQIRSPSKEPKSPHIMPPLSSPVVHSQSIDYSQRTHRVLEMADRILEQGYLENSSGDTNRPAMLELLNKISYQLSLLTEKVDALDVAMASIEKKQENMQAMMAEVSLQDPSEGSVDGNVSHIPVGEHHFVHHVRHVHHMHTLHVIGSAEETVDLTQTHYPTTTVYSKSDAPPDTLPGRALLRPRPEQEGGWTMEFALKEPHENGHALLTQLPNDQGYSSNRLNGGGGGAWTSKTSPSVLNNNSVRPASPSKTHQLQPLPKTNILRD